MIDTPTCQEPVWRQRSPKNGVCGHRARYRVSLDGQPYVPDRFVCGVHVKRYTTRSVTPLHPEMEPW